MRFVRGSTYILAASMFGAGLMAFESGVAVAQQTPIVQTGAVLGRVTDTKDRAIAATEIRLITIEGAIVASAVGDSSGRFAFPKVTTGGPYIVVVRKIGLAPAQTAPFTLGVNDTLRFAFKLDAAVQLSTVEITGGRGGSALTSKVIREGEFNAKYVYSVLDMLRRYRPKMFGDVDRCQVPGQWTVQHVYVNGVQRDRYSPPASSEPNFGPRRAGDSVPINPEVERVLDLIQSKDVAEVRYVDCNDELLPPERRNAIYITLKPKPLTEKQKKAIFENTRRP